VGEIEIGEQAEDCRTYRIALRAMWCGQILSDVIAHLPRPASAFRVMEKELRHQVCQSPASFDRSER
jgi:hypothetical protein